MSSEVATQSPVPKIAADHPQLAASNTDGGFHTAGSGGATKDRPLRATVVRCKMPRREKCDVVPLFSRGTSILWIRCLAAAFTAVFRQEERNSDNVRSDENNGPAPPYTVLRLE